jgi:signal transduction histidine kinase
MDDLIWNTKPENDSLESLIVRMREYGAEILEAAGIGLTLNCPVALYSIKLDMQQKRNLYLIFKEAINNLAKYSNTKNAFIQFEYQKRFLEMIIKDEGPGFTLASIKKGNGLDNMQYRATEMNAQFEINSGNGNGTTIRVHVPV